MSVPPGYAHRFVPAPPGGDGRTLLLLHGTGGSEDDLLPLGPMLDEGAALLAPRGRVLENGMARFFRRIAEGVFDEADLRVRTAELAAFVRAAAAGYGFDAHRVVAAGYSNGANIAASLLLLEPGTLAGAVLFRPMVPFEPESLNGLEGVPVFIASGRDDPTMTPDQPERLATLLREAGADVTLHWEAAGHVLERREIGAARDWLARRHLARGLRPPARP